MVSIDSIKLLFSKGAELVFLLILIMIIRLLGVAMQKERREVGRECVLTSNNTRSRLNTFYRQHHVGSTERVSPTHTVLLSFHLILASSSWLLKLLLQDIFTALRYSQAPAQPIKHSQKKVEIRVEHLLLTSAAHQEARAFITRKDIQDN